MKSILSTTLAGLIVCLALSCDDHENAPQNMPKLCRLIIESNQFKTLNIDPAILETSVQPQEQFSNHGKVLIVDFRSTSKKKLFAVVDRNNLVDRVFTFEIQSVQDMKDISASLQNRTFNGTFVLTGREMHSFEIKNSNIISYQSKGDVASAMRPTCNDMEDAYYCAASTIDNMGTVAWLSCMSNIVVCMGISLADCLLEGCPRAGV